MRSQWIFRLSLFTVCNTLLFLIIYYQPRIPYQFIHINQSESSLNQQLVQQIDEKILSPFQYRLNRRWFHLGQKYSSLNLSFLVHIQNTSRQILTYSCLKNCGGWGDRLRGITSTYLLAVFLQRRFQIDMSYPCDLNDFLRPNFIDWQRTIDRKKSFHLDMIHRNYSQDFYQKLSRQNIGEIWKNIDQISLMTNQDYITPLMKNPHFSSIKAQLNLSSKHSTQVDLFPLIFEILFQPTRIVLDQLDELYMKSLARTSIICVHIRLGRNPTVPKDSKFEHRDHLIDDVITFIDRNLNQTDSSIFVTSDSFSTQTKMIEHFGSHRIITTPGPIIHIDRFDSHKQLYQGFLKVIVDFYFLGECDTIVKSRSGFSDWANERRLNKYQNFYLYCRGFHRVTNAKWRRPFAIC